VDRADREGAATDVELNAGASAHGWVLRLCAEGVLSPYIYEAELPQLPFGKNDFRDYVIPTPESFWPSCSHEGQ
jgi:hypothetical protein